MGYKLGIGFLLFGILLSNTSSEVNVYDIFFLAGLLFGFIGLILVIAAHVREKKTYFSNRTFNQYEQNNVFVQNDMNERR